MADDRPISEPYPPGSAPAPPRPPVVPADGKRPEIVLNPATQTRPQAQTDAARKASLAEPKDSFREVIETIVFVVVLVLLLKTFLAEAFVIPTGSMAPTLLGYQHQVTCSKCNYPFPVNASREADPQERHPQPVVSCVCPNCQYRNVLRPDFPGRLPQ